MVISNGQSTYRDPFILDDVGNCESLLWIGFEHPPNEIFGVLRDVGPFRLGKLVLARANALLHAGGDGKTMVAVEWRKPTQPGEGDGEGKQRKVEVSSSSSIFHT